MIKKIAFLSTAAAFVFGVTMPAANAKEFTDEEKTEIIKVVDEYLAANPQKIIESLDKYHMEQMKKAEAEKRKQMKKIMPKVESDVGYPFIGDEQGTFKIVEFFDYNCGYCKRMFPEVLKFVEKDGKSKWILKELPTLSPESTTAAKYALAANEQGKYKEIHTAFMKHSGKLDEAAMQKYAKDLGLDMTKLDADVKSDKIQKQLDANRELATQAQVSGIPTFAINGEIRPGAFDVSVLDQDAVKARTDKPKKKVKKVKKVKKSKAAGYKEKAAPANIEGSEERKEYIANINPDAASDDVEDTQETTNK